MSGEWPPAQGTPPPADDLFRPVPTPQDQRPSSDQAWLNQPAALGQPPFQGWTPPTYGSPYGTAPYSSPYGSYPPGPPAAWSVAPPRPLSDVPPPPPPKRTGWAAALPSVVGIVLLALVVTFALPALGQLHAPGRGPADAGPPGRSTATPRPSSSPTSSSRPRMPSDPKDVVRKNPIYALKVPASCPRQSRPASRAQFTRQVKGLMACENAAWKKALAGGPVTFAKPKVVFYNTRTSSPCGKLGTYFPAAYCSSNRTMYFSVASYRQGRYYRLAVAGFVMHEYAHHIQELAGILDSGEALDEGRSVTSRRVELQAHCMAHYQLSHSGIGFGNRDRSDAEFQFSYAGDPKGHGSAAAARYWGRRGLDAPRIGSCNTWSVKAGKVK